MVGDYYWHSPFYSRTCKFADLLRDFYRLDFFTKQSSTQFHKFATTLSTKRVRSNLHCLEIESSYENQARTDDKSSVNSSARTTTEQVSFHRMKKLQSSSHGQGMHDRLHERIFAVST